MNERMFVRKSQPDPAIEFPRRRQFGPPLFRENSIKMDRLLVEIGRAEARGANRMRIDDISRGVYIRWLRRSPLSLRRNTTT